MLHKSPFFFLIFFAWKVHNVPEMGAASPDSTLFKLPPFFPPLQQKGMKSHYGGEGGWWVFWNVKPFCDAEIHHPSPCYGKWPFTEHDQKKPQKPGPAFCPGSTTEARLKLTPSSYVTSLHFKFNQTCFFVLFLISVLIFWTLLV